MAKKQHKKPRTGSFAGAQRKPVAATHEAEDNTVTPDKPAGHIHLPEAFVQSLGSVPGLADVSALIAALDSEPPVSVRFNPFKISEKPEGRQVPWSRYGYYLDSRPQFTLDPLMHGGAYYVQEPSSMFVEHIFRSVTDREERLRVLDLCAAPGGKTTLLSTVAGLESLVVANEPVRQRAMALSDNVKRWGLGNVVVTNNDPSHFEGFRDYFDIILVDAPCSGEGMFRKNPEARTQWTPDNVKLCAARQRRILGEIWDALKPGGTLIYTTCTFNRAENEDNVEWLVSEFGCEDAGVETDLSWGVVAGSTEGGIATFRFFPGLVGGEGFFAAAVCKPDGKVRTKVPKARRNAFTDPDKATVRAVAEWFGQPEYMRFALVGDNIYAYYSATYADVRTVCDTLSPVYSGVMAGQLFGGKLRPEHPLALFHDLNRGIVPEAELELEDALRYLRKEDIDPALLAEGMNLVAFGGLPIGWIKRIGHRSNNMYPKEVRITNL